MRKTYQVIGSNHKPPRVIDAIRSDIRKYLKRERGKTLPEGVDFWDFDCRVGKDAESAKDSHIKTISKDLEEALTNEWSTAYIEVLTKPGRRMKRER